MAEIDDLYTKLFTNQTNVIENEIDDELNMEGDNVQLDIEDLYDKEPQLIKVEPTINELKQSLNKNLKLFNFGKLKEFITYIQEYSKTDLIIYQYCNLTLDYSFQEFKGIIVQLNNKQIKWSWEYLDLLKSGLTGNIPFAEHIYNYFWEDNPFIPFLIFLYYDLIDYNRINFTNNQLPTIINKYFTDETIIDDVNKEVFLGIYHNYIDFPLNTNFSLFFSWSLNEFLLVNIKWKPFALYGSLISGYLVYKENEDYIIVSPSGIKNKLPSSYTVKKKSYIKINRKPKEINFNSYDNVKIGKTIENNEQIIIKLNGIEFDSYTLSYWKSKLNYLINGTNEGQLVLKINDLGTINFIINYLESYQTGIPKNNEYFTIEKPVENDVSLIDTFILIKLILIAIFTSKKEMTEDFLNVVYQIDGNDYVKQLNLLSNISSGNGVILLEKSFIYGEKHCYPHKGLYRWYKNWIQHRSYCYPIFMLRTINSFDNSETEINCIYSRINNIGFLNIINYPGKKMIRICSTIPRKNEIEYREVLLGLLLERVTLQVNLN